MMSGPLDLGFVLAGIALMELASQRTSQEAAWIGQVEAIRPAVRTKRPPPRAAETGPPVRVPRQRAPSQKADVPREAPAPIPSAFVDALADLIIEIEVRGEAFTADETVRETCRTEISAWRERKALHASMPPSAEAVARGKELVAQADEIVTKAFEIVEQRRKRDYVLQAIVESLHAVGYFTDEPIHPIVSEPGGPVTLTARKADEQVTITLPLGEDVVRSTWDGFAGDACVDSFMEYIAALDERGVSCKPCEQLADGPKLRTAGQKDLPRSDTRGN